MNLPGLDPVAILNAAGTAARQAGRLAARAVPSGNDRDFADVLKGESTDRSSRPPLPRLEDATATLASQIRRQLAEAGIPVNPALRFSVQHDGRIRVEEDHPQAARVEALLADDPQTVELARKFFAAGGRNATTDPQNRLDSRLTPGDPPESIEKPFGGYANW